jgi:uncharacterized repeat protein (TIGR03833 family)
MRPFQSDAGILQLISPELSRYNSLIMENTNRANIKAGKEVLIVLKQDQGTGRLTRGIVKDILTKSSTHPHGIKVRLQDGQVGRVKEIIK